jgi:hypothetical protein
VKTGGTGVGIGSLGSTMSTSPNAPAKPTTSPVSYIVHSIHLKFFFNICRCIFNPFNDSFFIFNFAYSHGIVGFFPFGKKLVKQGCTTHR